MNNKISVIIPTLNEASGIRKLLRHLDAQSGSGQIEEVILADGGSRDMTCDMAVNYRADNFKILVIKGDRGRARQQNHGASIAKGTILYFLHADSFPPEGFDNRILQAVEQGYHSGCFRLKFDEAHPLLTFSQWFTRFNLQLCRGGDQSLFIRKELFDAMGGFNENFVIYEDGEFHDRIYKNGTPFKVLKPAITTSARRYRENGFWNLQYHFTRVHLMYRMGYGPEKIHEYYLRNIC
ncbi:TIGR04283 family arsenosugar biosynthesis glycosyltransferase [Robertkochia flava]|uniref:TIGR04283 family arsenosugar biosynthesis glycosyltransferase n=1 Tax=Robertkochia flava TaxID=3447986 RepID=UPI001CCAE765|nr:TIGR04283 family arsenosugar biosynthesis glycosyltransferase [Robertkochia marina]